jgi:protein-tyrosine kinase
MSRIDEALKRFSSEEPEPRAVFGPGDRPARRDEHVLEHYPPEAEAQAAHDLWPEGESAAETDPLAGQVLRQPSSERRPSPARPVPGAPHAFPGSPDPKLVGALDHGVFIEQYRRLAAAVHELQLDRGLKTMMVTSALPKEGKTLTVTNLALTLSGSYSRRVLLIDADLRRPTVHELLGLRNDSGLNEVLRSGRRTLPITQVSQHLSVLTAGRPDNDPLAVLTSDRMQSLLEDAAATYDWVLLDAPPVGIMPDAGLLAGITGASLLVISAGSTPYKLVERVIAELGRERIVGTVLNRIEDHNIPATGYYQEYYSGASTRA